MLPIYLQTVSSITAVPVCSTTETGPNGIHEIEKYILGELAKDEGHAHKIRIQVACFSLINGSL